MDYRKENNQNMRTVTVKKLELLAKLEENLAKHKQEFETAVAEYKLAALADLKERKENVLKDLKRMQNLLEKDPLYRLNSETHLSFDVKPPKSYVEQYEEAIEMFKAEVNDNVVLDSDEFSRYFLNKWAWAKELENVRSFYATKFRP